MIFFMTNFHVITEEYLNENKEITLSKNDDKEAIVLDLTIEREKYFNKEYDITAVEIKEKDNIKDFLEIDDYILKDKENHIYNRDFTEKSCCTYVSYFYLANAILHLFQNLFSTWYIPWIF